MKVVLDTNVYLSAVIFGGNPRHILDMVIQRKLKVIISPAILLEIAEKLRQKFEWNEDQILTVVQTLVRTAEVVKPAGKVNFIKADESDNRIVEAAVAGRASYIISGDRHLLKAKKYRDIKIVTPARFLDLYFSN